MAVILQMVKKHVENKDPILQSLGADRGNPRDPVIRAVIRCILWVIRVICNRE